MKTDSQLQRDVEDELRDDPRIYDSEIGVAVKNGVVTLGGTVKSFAQRAAAEHAVERLSGVRALADDLRVKLPGAIDLSDTDLAHRAAEALKWDVEVPDTKIRARVEKGWITLDGDVQWQYERQAANRAVRFLSGVLGVTNHIKILPRVSTIDVSSRIRDALRRTADAEAQHIDVEAKDGRVTLRGTVHSWNERAQATRAAWSTAGVMTVDDRLTVRI